MKTWKVFIPGSIWAVIILILSIIPNNRVPKFSWANFWNVDKAGHLFFYMVLAYFIMMAIGRYYSGMRARKVILIGIVSASLYGLLMESLQSFISPSRYFELLDLIANIIGSFIAILIYKFKP